MSAPIPRRKVTKAFVLGLVALTSFFGLALVVASWGLMALAFDSKPVTSDVGFGVAPAIVAVATAELFGMLWRMALRILRGRHSPPWGFSLLIAGLGFAIWAIFGLLAGLSFNEAVLTVYGLAIFVSWLIASFIFWLLLTRQVFTDRPTPLWPWERKELRDRERDT